MCQQSLQGQFNIHWPILVTYSKSVTWNFIDPNLKFCWKSWLFQWKFRENFIFELKIEYQKWILKYHNCHVWVWLERGQQFWLKLAPFWEAYGLTENPWPIWAYWGVNPTSLLDIYPIFWTNRPSTYFDTVIKKSFRQKSATNIGTEGSGITERSVPTKRD